MDVELPDGRTAEFPDDMPHEQINAVLAKQFPPPAPDPGLLANLASAANASAIGGPQMTAAMQTYIPGGSGYGKSFTENMQAQQAANRQVVSGHPVLSALVQGAEAVPEAVATAGMGPIGRAGLLANSLREAVAKNAILGGISAGLHGATNAPDWRNAISEGLKGGYEGAALGGGVTLGTALAGPAWSAIKKTGSDIGSGLKSAGNWAGRKLDIVSEPPPPQRVDPLAPIKTPTGYTMDSPMVQKNEAYQHAYDIGAAYRPGAYNDLVDKMVSDAKAAHINPVTNPKSSALLDEMQKDAAIAQQTGHPITLEQIDRWRHAIPSGEGETSFGRQFRQNIDEFVQKSGNTNAMIPPGLSLNRIHEPPLTPEESDLYLHSADEARQSIHGDEGAHYTINDPAGSVIGKTHLVYDPESKAVDVGWVGRKNANEMRGQYSDFANTLGSGQIRPLLAEVKREFPEAQTIGGFRVSGARMGPAVNKDAGASSTVMGNATLKLPALTPSGTPEAAEAIQSARQANQVYEKNKLLADLLEHKGDITGTNVTDANFASNEARAVHQFKDAQNNMGGGMTPEEAMLAQNVIRPGPLQKKILPAIARLSPLGGYGLGTLSDIGIGLAAHHPLPGITAGVIGELGRQANERMTDQSVKALQATILRGGRRAIPLPPQSRVLWQQRLYNPLMQQRQNVEDQYNAP